ncbi:MAG TPA: RNA 2',3'-cyclic phosphodiesterase [Propionibacteriaceae bacterium]|nr:RNA 2',3'-cyclic phosphodiesterase [Propionibacteriaceae bacterium]
MGQRLFAAVTLPPDVVDELERWVDPRRDDAWRWARSSDWHVTLAFYGDVEPWRYEPLVEGLTEAALRTRPFALALDGVGCFGSVDKARVLYAGVVDPDGVLPRLAASSRTAATTVGIEVARQKYQPHVTLARRNRASDAARHVRALGELRTRSWHVSEFVLVESFLGQGPRGTARHEVREHFPLAPG